MTDDALLPLLGLRIIAGPLELRGITDDLLGSLAALALEGVHEPDAMPFYVPWTAAPAEELPRNFAQFHWGQRSSFSVGAWSMELAVLWDGEVAGVQGFTTQDYLVTRSGETGSWLGRRFQGRGIGTAMRRAMCAFVFDHLDGEEVASAAFADNPASLAVSRKVGFRANGTARFARGDETVVLNRLVLSPADLVRPEGGLTVEGLEPFRRSIGLPVGR